MKRFALSLLCGICGYVMVAIAGHFLIDGFSANVHDRSLEAAMTSAFVLGPVGAIVAFVVTFVRMGHRSPAANQAAAGN
ncbi:MAG: hypothetical protein ABIR52_01765 [Casimicrobiaceae bacterium]